MAAARGLATVRMRVGITGFEKGQDYTAAIPADSFSTQ